MVTRMILPDSIFSEIASPRKFSGKKFIAIIGGGPAGLMSAEAAAAYGHKIIVFDSMPSMGRKLLMAGRGGLNITHTEPSDQFCQRFGPSAEQIGQFINVFGPQHIVQWCRDLGIETFVGSSGRVFPKDFKAAPLLRAWIKRLRSQGVIFHARHRWTGWTAHNHLSFETPNGPRTCQPDATILALGGGSWPHLGSDGQWVATLETQGIACAPLTPSNCGFDMDWSEHLRTRFAGIPLKSVVLSHDGHTAKGDVILTDTGLEGTPLYQLSARLRDSITANGPSIVHLDLCPDHSLTRLAQILATPRGSRSLSSHLKRCTGLPAPALALLHEYAGASLPNDPHQLASLIKAVPLLAQRPRPLTEAISSGGGIKWHELDPNLQVKSHPGLFVCGEMLDWEAPTGGYLLTGCLSTGFTAGTSAATIQPISGSCSPAS